MSVRSRRAIPILILAPALALRAAGDPSVTERGPTPQFRVDWSEPDAREFRALPGIGAITADRLMSALRAGTPVAELAGVLKGLSVEARRALAEQGMPEAAAVARTAVAARPGERQLNPNAATPEELEALPGIGPALARRIIAARPFEDLEDFVDRVEGIGPKLGDRLGPLLRFDDPEGELAGSADPR